MSHSTLYRTLKNEGKTLKMIVLHIRIINSQKLLVNTNMSINELSNRCGFNSPSYFSRKFK
ncbi:helix-turn-helix transcriptional regulator, partial [Vibrio vulnificus]|nr:helix-turn-helix transcriptional regulator [Vibrio vulnificus]